MHTRRLNITLPEGIAERLGEKPNKSGFIAEALREKLDAEESAGRSEKLALAYREASREDKHLLDDWDHLAGESL